ncbi:MAG: hypothetical protein CR974_03825 [Gammaproteobacteria bacterium]|nr:MAG: hypothetical protein CR974_03825 [Gammaproteobacteria bacterium]
MDKKQLDEVLACFENERRIYRYFSDKYCVDILSRWLGEGKSISEIKRSPLAGFLHRPWVKAHLAKLGSNRLTADTLALWWRDDEQHFQQTLAAWSDTYDWRWGQTSRRGYNLVLQLNFTQSHNRDYDKWIKGSRFCVYDASYHPVYQGEERHTMAWARIDMSDDLSEALIEEIQTDWLRDAERTLRHAKGASNNRCSCLRCRENAKVTERQKQAFEHYHQRHIAPMLGIWDEAMLNAALSFLFDDIGVERVFYHDFATGNALKHIDCGKPPRSLYTQLPKRFGFVKTQEFPTFLPEKSLRKRLKKVQAPMFYVMKNLDNG